MADEVDDVIFQVSLVDNASEDTEEIGHELLELDAIEDKVNPLRIDVNIGLALAELQTVESALRRLDEKDATVDVETDTDFGGGMGRMRGSWPYDQTDEGILTGDPFALHLPSRGLDEPSHRRRFMPDMTNQDRRDMFGIDMPSIDEALGMGDPHERRGLLSRALDRIPDSARKLGRSFANVRVSMGLLMNILAALIPLLVVFVGALPAAIAGLGALAGAAIAATAALGGVIGLGLLGMALEGGEFNFETLRKQLQSTIDELLAAISPIAEGLQPLAETMFRLIEQAGYDVAMRMRQIMSLTDDVRRAMRGAADAIGPFLEQTLLLGESAMPMMFAFAQRLGNMGFFEVLSGVLAETLPLLVGLAAAVGRALPAIFEMSMGFFMFTTALIEVATRVIQLTNLFPGMARGLGILISLILTGITVSALWSIWNGRLMASFRKYSVMIYTQVHGAIMTYTSSTWLAHGATVAFTLAAATLIGILTLGLGPALGFISTEFTLVGDDIKNATDQLRRFNQLERRTGLGGGVSQLEGEGGPGYDNPASSVGSGSFNGTVVAPDQETGNALLNTATFRTETKSIPVGDVENRTHSG